MPNDIKLSGSNVITALTAHSCLEDIFARSGHPVTLPPIEPDCVTAYQELEDLIHNRAPLQDHTIIALRSILLGRLNTRFPYINLHRYMVGVIDAIRGVTRANPDATASSICLNEIEVTKLGSTLKLIMTMSEMTTGQHNNYMKSFMTDRYNHLERKLLYNIKLTKRIVANLYMVFFSYWLKNCKDKRGRNKNTEFLEKCGYLFALKTTPDHANPVLGHVMIPNIHDISEGSGGSEVLPECQRFLDTFELTPHFRGSTQNALNNILAYFQQLSQDRSHGSRMLGRTQIRATYIGYVLRYLKIRITSGRDKHIEPIDHQEFIDEYRLPSRRPQDADTTEWDRFISQIPNEPIQPHLAFDLFSDVDFFENLQAVFNITSSLRLAITPYDPRPAPDQDIVPPDPVPATQPTLGHDPQYNLERTTEIRQIANAQSVETLLAIRNVWFQSDGFQEHPGCLNRSKHWTITPGGIVVRISERNSRLNLLLAIKLYYLWTLDQTMQTRRSSIAAGRFNELIDNQTQLWFMKAARKTYIVNLANKGGQCNIQRVQKSSVYKGFEAYWQRRKNADYIRNYLERRWTEYIQKMVRNYTAFSGGNGNRDIRNLPIMGENRNPPAAT